MLQHLFLPIFASLERLFQKPLTKSSITRMHVQDKTQLHISPPEQSKPQRSVFDQALDTRRWALYDFRENQRDRAPCICERKHHAVLVNDTGLWCSRFGWLWP